MSETQPSVKQLWNAFINKHPEYRDKNIPESFYFCDNETDATICANLVLKRIKQATATSLWWFKTHNQALPKKGDLNIVTDWDGNAVAVIKTTQLDIVPFNKVTEAFAQTEGEGDGSLAYWRKVHKAFYTREMKNSSDSFNEEMLIVCERFETLYP